MVGETGQKTVIGRGGVSRKTERTTTATGGRGGGNIEARVGTGAETTLKTDIANAGQNAPETGVKIPETDTIDTESARDDARRLARERETLACKGFTIASAISSSFSLMFGPSSCNT